MAYLPFSDDATGASMSLVQGADYQPSEQGARLYIGVDDLEASLDRALQAGAELRFGPADAGDWRVAEIRDSEGNRIANASVEQARRYTRTYRRHRSGQHRRSRFCRVELARLLLTALPTPPSSKLDATVLRRASAAASH
ncbi:hypothetical protein G6F68_014493 [Rhizopus microsporus]|nr:hypothetical protein G6F68_014493 [Rhizopus microsporus]